MKKMKTTSYRLPAAFAPENRFELPPNPPAPFRAAITGEFERLQGILLRNLLHSTDDANINLLYRHAVIEAAALAATTDYPALVLPVLVDEKARAAREYARLQARIHARGSPVSETQVA